MTRMRSEKIVSHAGNGEEKADLPTTSIDVFAERGNVWTNRRTGLTVDFAKSKTRSNKRCLRSDYKTSWLGHVLTTLVILRRHLLYTPLPTTYFTYCELNFLREYNVFLKIFKNKNNNFLNFYLVLKISRNLTYYYVLKCALLKCSIIEWWCYI